MQDMEKKKTEPMHVAKKILPLLLLLFVGYHSVYFRNLDEVKAEKIEQAFDPAAYAMAFWEKKLIPNLDQGVDLNELISQLQTEPEKAFESYSHALGIGNIRFFLVKGSAQVTEVREDEIEVSLISTQATSIRIATEFIFGNAVRDASGLININEFNNTMDFNNVSAEINKIIREEVIPTIKDKLKAGDVVVFHGAIEMNKQHLEWSDFELIPIQVEIISQ